MIPEPDRGAMGPASVDDYP